MQKADDIALTFCNMRIEHNNSSNSYLDRKAKHHLKSRIVLPSVVHLQIEC